MTPRRDHSRQPAVPGEERRGRVAPVPPPSRISHRVGALLAALALCVAGPLLACYGPEYYSVRFNSEWTDFFRMPQPWRGVPPEKRALPGAAANYSRKQEDSAYDEGSAAEPARLARAALRQEAAGQFRKAASVWRRYAQERQIAYLDSLSSYEDTETWGKLPQAKGLEDRIAALQAWRGPRDTAALRAYLRARDLVNARKYPPRPRSSFPPHPAALPAARGVP
jgi:hypothetical protein